MSPLFPLECRLLLVFLAALCNKPNIVQEELIPVSLREPPTALLINEATPSFCDAAGSMGMVAMSDLKSASTEWGRARNLSEDSTTKAIYALVAKGLFKIDRRNAKDPFILWDP